MTIDNLTFWLTIRAHDRGFNAKYYDYRITKGKPNQIRLDEITVKCRLQVDTDWFKKPMFEADLELGTPEFPDYPDIKQIEEILIQNGIKLELKLSRRKDDENNQETSRDS